MGPAVLSSCSQGADLIALLPLLHRCRPVDPARAPLAWLAVEKLTLENVAECRIEKAVEPSDRIELLHIDKTVRHAGWIDMHVDHFSNDKGMPVRAEFKDSLELAFEMNRHLFDTRRPDFDARDRRKAGFGELGIARREGIGRINHFPPHRLRYHVDAEFAGFADVLKRMLLAAIGIARDCQRDHRRNDTDHGKKGKRRKITDSALAYGRCPADRPRHYSPSEESINLTFFDDCGIELKIIGIHYHERSD